MKFNVCRLLQLSALSFLTSYGSSLDFIGSDLYYGNTSYNFIDRWGFQEICNHQFNPRDGNQPVQPFNPESVKPGDLIFVRNVSLFIKTMHKKIQNPYIIISSGDANDIVHDRFLTYLTSEKIIAFFSIHPCQRKHPKFYPIPLGIWQKKELYSDRQTVNQQFIQLRNRKKTHLLYLNLDLVFKKNPLFNNRLRKSIAKLLHDKPYVLHRTKKLPFKDYLEDMAQCIFVACPQGYGPDTFRTWEALLSGCIPIVSKNPWNNSVHQQKSANQTNHAFDLLHKELPVLAIDNWNTLNEEFLHEKSIKICSKKYNLEKLYLDYWCKIIFDVRDTYLKEYNTRKQI